ncbi:uncharacterized protein LOC127078752 [Lathyrus oleraceus]|uniref:uncharacterized protein LOC127078752 n=1 Tax=Pisum sativum TaxID=3888 RepID=UPI0021D13C92|nr:uncharacterized protein LOC127078752 [Pisum sativum]
MPKFAKFTKALLTGTKQKPDKKQVNMTEKCDTTLLQTMPTKLKDPGKFSISSTIGGVEIPYALYDFGSSINLMPLNKAKGLNLKEIMPNNGTLTLVNLSVTHPHGVLQDVLIYVDGLVIPTDFVVVDMKGDICGSIILRRPFLAIMKVLIDLKTDELSLNFNSKKCCLMLMNGHSV